MTGIKEIDKLIRIASDKKYPAWKRKSARLKLVKIQDKYNRIRHEIDNSEEYPYDKIWGIVRGTEAQDDN